MRRDYELGFILNPEVSEEQTGAILERIEKIVKNYDGQVVKVNQWGRRRLAYPIEHHRDGYYVFIDMILTPETVLELDRNLKVSEEVMRHIVKRRDPKAVQKEREEREARAAAAATQAQASAASKLEAEVEVQAPVESATEVEVQAPVESAAEVEVQAPVESTTEPEEEILVVGEEEPVVLSPEELEYVPPAIEEEEETIEA
ncbi:MAG TPA: 30S ribosomal protein S6 [Ktedonobacteraceae bacterium]